MSIDVIKDGGSWKEIISCYEHDFYHTWDFHFLSCENGEGTPVLFKLDYEGETIVFPLLERDIVSNDLYKDLVSVYGYPGPLFSIQDDAIKNVLLNKLFDEISQLNYVSLFSRLHPIINNNFKEYSKEVGHIVYFDLTDSIEEIYGSMRKVHSRDIRKLKRSDFILKGHTKVTDKEISDFKNIYDLTMEKIGALEYYYFTQDFYEKLFNSSDFEASLFTVYLEEKAVASAMIIQTDSFSQYHLSGTLPEFYKQHPMKLILGCAMEEMHRRGLKYFILGGGVGSKKDSLFDFKYGFSRKVAPFSVMSKIFKLEVYQELSHKRFKELGLSGESTQEISYFPLYRYS